MSAVPHIEVGSTREVGDESCEADCLCNTTVKDQSKQETIMVNFAKYHFAIQLLKKHPKLFR